jgi:HPt (histidine-containing phosphotransfer) domain-containing protein
VDDVLAKPVTPETLAAALARRAAGPAGADVAARPAGPGALDPARLAELRDPDPAGYEPPIADLARSFLSQGAAMLQRLADAVRADDAGTAEHEARALKGAAGNLGAARLADLAADLESMARRGRLEGAREILRGMEDEFGHVRRELAAVVAER